MGPVHVIHSVTSRQQSQRQAASAQRWPAGPGQAALAASRAARRAAGRGAGRPGRDRRLPVHRAEPSELPVYRGMAGGQLAGRGTPHPGRPAAVPGADRRVRPRRLPSALLRRVGRGGPRARRLLPAAAAGIPGVLARLPCRAWTPGPARDGQHRGGTGAAGVFAATYFATDTWLDVGRVDSLFLALSIGGLYAARHMRGTPRCHRRRACCWPPPPSPSRPGSSRGSR